MLNLLKVERERMGISSIELAKLVNCSEQTISDIENFKLIPSHKLMIRISNILKISPEKIFNLTI